MTHFTRIATLLVALVLPASAFAAGDSHGPDWGELGSQIVNFCIYIALIVFVARKPAQEFFATRRAAVVDAMNASEQAVAAAEARLAETMKKLDTLDEEKAAVLREFRELGESERRRIVAAAESDAAKIVRDAEIAAERELRLAKAALERRMVDSALEKARQDVVARMNPMTQNQLIDNGIDALSSAG